MEELQDYSGEFKPDLKIEEFSKSALIRQWNTAAKLLLGIDSIWRDLVREHFGEEMATQLGIEAWRRATPIHVRRGRKSLNFEGNDVAAFFKYWQIDPACGGVSEEKYELVNQNHGILTIMRCQPLDYMEKQGDIAGIEFACAKLDKEAFQFAASCINPNIEVTCLRRPPRTEEEKASFACQWEFKLQE